MRVLQVNPVLRSGSTGWIASDICDVLRADGEEGAVAYGRGKPVRGHYPFGSALSFYTHAAATRLFDTHGLHSRLATRKLLEIMRTWKPDIVHLHNVHGYYLSYPLLFDFLRRVGVPVVWTLHDSWPVTGHCAFPELKRCERWRMQCGRCPAKRLYPKSWIIDNSRANLARKKRVIGKMKHLTIVTPSNWLAKRVLSSFLGKFRLEVIHNGVDTDAFVAGRGDVVRDRNEFRLLAVANIWNERKGLKYLLRLMDALPLDCTLTVVGKLEERLPAIERVTHVPRTDSTQALADLYAGADVFVNPTLADNFPMTNIEAMACGTPVVGFQTGGNPEAITTETGVLVPTGDLKGIVDGVMLVRARGKTRYSEHCIRRVREKFSKFDRYRDYVRLYHELLREGRDGGGRHVR